jgi:uncharacterized protein YoxC
MDPNLSTTNLLLGIMTAVSVLEGLLLVGTGIAGWVMYRRVTDLVASLEQRHVVPAMTRVNAILDDVQGVTAKLRQETERVDQAIRDTVHRVDDTADRVRASVRVKTSAVVGVVRGLRTAIEHMLRWRQPAEGRS